MWIQIHQDPESDCLASSTWSGAQQALLDAGDERIRLPHQTGGAARPGVSSTWFIYFVIVCVDIGVYCIALPRTAQLCVACAQTILIRQCETRPEQRGPAVLKPIWCFQLSSENGEIWISRG